MLPYSTGDLAVPHPCAKGQPGEGVIMKAKNGKILLIAGITLFVAMVIGSPVGFLPRCSVPVLAGLALFLAGLGGVVMELGQKGEENCDQS